MTKARLEGGQASLCAYLRDGVGCTVTATRKVDGVPYCGAHGPGSAPVAGTKADAGKLGTHLLPTRPLEAVARVLDFGARKYAPNNWRAGIAYSRVYGAVLRHLWAWWRGERIDPDSGQHHLACACCELLFLLEYEIHDEKRRTTIDDRAGSDLPPGSTE